MSTLTKKQRAAHKLAQETFLNELHANAVENVGTEKAIKLPSPPLGPEEELEALTKSKDPKLAAMAARDLELLRNQPALTPGQESEYEPPPETPKWEDQTDLQRLELAANLGVDKELVEAVKQRLRKHEGT